MKVHRTAKDKLVFQLGRRERDLLLRLLRLYPCVPPAHQPASRTGAVPEPEETQRLLDEALAEQRAENRQLLQGLLADPQRYQVTTTGCRLTLSPGDLEWLLQILNDIRVGSWVQLGAPEEKLESLDETTAPHYWAMEMSGLFQMQLLAALEHPESA